MPEVTGHETHQRAHARLDQDEGSCFVSRCRPQLQLTAIARLPAGIQIENRRHDAVAGASMTIQMRLVEGSFRIDGKVAFILKQAEKEPLVQGQPQQLQPGQKDNLLHRRRIRLEPHHLITADVITDLPTQSTSHTRAFEITAIRSLLTFRPQPQRIRLPKTPRHRGPAKLVHRIEHLDHVPTSESTGALARQIVRFRGGQPRSLSASGKEDGPAVNIGHIATMRLLIIDDDTELCQLVADYLKPMGFEVEMAHDGEQGAERATAESWAAIILDVMMPGCDGFEVLRRIRTKSKVPVMMLTGRGEEVDRIVGLELGADDYLPKTFSSRELLARLRALLRRTGWIAETAPQAPVKEIVIGELRINPETHDVILGDQPVPLTPAEFGLLLSLAKAHGRVKTREQLIEEVADREWDVFDRAIDMHISSLRKKLGDDPKEPRFIKTVRGYGYQLVTPGR